MSARKRAEAFHRAVEAGKDAFRRGDPRDSCPFKKSAWGNGGAWDMGWCRARDEANRVTPEDENRAENTP